MRQYLVTMLIALVASVATFKVMAPTATSTAATPTAARESSYERIMRTGTIRCGYFIWEPFMYKDAQTNQLMGINYEMMERIGDILGFKIEWTTQADIGTYSQDLASGKYDVVCASVWPNAARINNSLLTDAEVWSVAYAFVRTDDTRLDGDLRKANSPEITMAVFDGDYTQDIAKQTFPQAKTFSMAANASGGDMLVALANGKVDFVVADMGIYHQFNKSNPGKLRPVANVAPVRVFGEYLAVPLGEHQLKNMLDMAIQVLNGNRVFENILKKYEANGYVLSSFAVTDPFTLHRRME